MQKVIIITDSDVNSHSLGKEIQNQTLGSPLKNVTSFLFWGRGSIRFFFFQLFIYWQAESLVAAGGIFLVMAYKLLVVVYGI